MSNNVFSFNNQHKLKLVIEGEEFYVDTSDVQMIKEIDKFAQEATLLADKGEKEGVEALEEVLEYCVVFVDTILGKGAAKKIFKDRRVGLFDLLNLIEFLSARISEDRFKKINSFAKKF